MGLLLKLSPCWCKKFRGAKQPQGIRRVSKLLEDIELIIGVGRAEFAANVGLWLLSWKT